MHTLCVTVQGPSLYWDLLFLATVYARNTQPQDPATLPSLSLRKEPSGRPSQPRLPFSASWSSLVPMGYLPGSVRQQYPVQCTYSPGQQCTAYFACWACVDSAHLQGPGPRPALPPPARQPACLPSLPAAHHVAATGLIVRPHQTKSNASARKRGQSGKLQCSVVAAVAPVRRGRVVLCGRSGFAPFLPYFPHARTIRGDMLAH